MEDTVKEAKLREDIDMLLAELLQGLGWWERPATSSGRVSSLRLAHPTTSKKRADGYGFYEQMDYSHWVLQQEPGTRRQLSLDRLAFTDPERTVMLALLTEILPAARAKIAQMQGLVDILTAEARSRALVEVTEEPPGG